MRYPATNEIVASRYDGCVFAAGRASVSCNKYLKFVYKSRLQPKPTYHNRKNPYIKASFNKNSYIKAGLPAL
jgi:hypothetical protein